MKTTAAILAGINFVMPQGSCLVFVVFAFMLSSMAQPHTADVNGQRPAKPGFLVGRWSGETRVPGAFGKVAPQALGWTPYDDQASKYRMHAFNAGRRLTTDTPSAEMQKLFDRFLGSWVVDETFEISASDQGKQRHGTATFRAGPGSSLIEEYRSDGSAGKLNFLALLWWDPPAQAYRLFTCANDDGCVLRGTAQWEGNALVNSWRQEVKGKQFTFKDSFVDISPAAFRLVSEGLADGKTIWRVITHYRRSNGPR